ncbi:MAG: GMC family oxidoreductase N-terminal domain-containing protein [Comamonadaceae bacterium]|nr:GMC family oxidoreductase N-terminal domain-containing protein [Comamonadaceae bacterium]
MLVTTIPAALDRGATLLVQTRARAAGDRWRRASRRRRLRAAWRRTARAERCAQRARARRATVVVAGGAINSPALLLRSRLPDPHELLGRRTFLHPVVAVDGDRSTSPSTAGTARRRRSTRDHFLERRPDRRADRLQARGAAAAPGASRDRRCRASARSMPQAMQDFAAHARAARAAARRLPRSSRRAAASRLRSDGTPVLDYPLNDFVCDGARRALLSMAEIQFAAGARDGARRRTRWRRRYRQLGRGAAGDRRPCR